MGARVRAGLERGAGGAGVSTREPTARPGGPTPGPGPGEGGPSIRLMTRADLPAVLAIERSVFTVPWTPVTFRTLMRQAGARLWVAERDGEVIGYAAVWAVLDQAELGNVAVAPEHRRRGVASTLVTTVLRWLEERRVREVFLEVRASNREAQRLYERHGFRPVGRRKGYYSRPREDALVLRRPVAPGGVGLTD